MKEDAKNHSFSPENFPGFIVSETVRLSKCDLYRLALTVILVAGFRLQCSGVSQNLLKPETHKWLNSLQLMSWLIYVDIKREHVLNKYSGEEINV